MTFLLALLTAVVCAASFVGAIWILALGGMIPASVMAFGALTGVVIATRLVTEL